MLKRRVNLMLTLALRPGFHSIFQKFEQVMANLILDFIRPKLWNEIDEAERFKCLASNLFKKELTSYFISRYYSLPIFG